MREGYAVEPVFDPALVSAAAGDVAEHVDRVSRALYLPFGQSFPDEPLGSRLDRIWQQDRSQANLLRIAICTDAHRGPRLQALVNSPELRAAAQALTDERLTGQVVRMRAGIASFPEHLHPWHSDVARDDGTDCSRVCVTAWIPLSDAGPESGGLEVIPGRRSSPLPHQEEHAFSISECELVGQEAVRPFCPLGSVLFLDRFTPHRSLPVRGQARFALVIWIKSAA
jgi:hypothetical protein